MEPLHRVENPGQSGVSDHPAFGKLCRMLGNAGDSVRRRFWEKMMGRRRVSIDDQVREALRKSKITRYQIWKETGIDQAGLSRFVHGEAGLSIANLEMVADCLGLELKAVKRV